ncbi:MAG: IS110 family transposase [Candidatus Poribacteria bacterium]|nr:IS110 family transposase [Candidatus Poribacteria bacterium]
MTTTKKTARPIDPSWSVLGVDIAKDKVDAMLFHDGKQRPKVFRFSRTESPERFVELTRWLTARGVEVVHICMEATGSYWEPLAEFLHDAGHRVSVVNPAQAAAYAKSRLSRNKTDAADAETLAWLAATQQPSVWMPLPFEARQLREWARHREALVVERQRHANRLETTRDTAVRASLERLIAQLNEEIRRLEREMDDHIDRHPDLKTKRDLLSSIVSIGNLTAALIVAEAPRLAEYAHVKKAVAYAGLNPRQWQSGSSVRGKTRLSKKGNARLRRILYMPSLSAIRYNPVIRAFYQQLIERGKTKMQAIGAVMHKLLRIAYGVLKHGKPFDPNILKTA